MIERISDEQKQYACLSVVHCGYGLVGLPCGSGRDAKPINI
jgi:hypothetical protein